MDEHGEHDSLTACTQHSSQLRHNASSITTFHSSQKVEHYCALAAKTITGINNKAQLAHQLQQKSVKISQRKGVMPK